MIVVRSEAKNCAVKIPQLACLDKCLSCKCALVANTVQGFFRMNQVNLWLGARAPSPANERYRTARGSERVKGSTNRRNKPEGMIVLDQETQFGSQEGLVT
jgi:hypothetical protein